MVDVLDPTHQGKKLTVTIDGYEDEHRLEVLLRLGTLNEILTEDHHLLIDLDADDLEWLPPIEDPHVIVCAGQNFALHASESAEVGTPTRPSAFLRVGRTLTGHSSTFPYPASTRQLDYEVEVAAIMAAEAVDVTPEDALSHVAGLCLANDISARDIQFEEARAGSMLLGKNLPGSLPLGPWITTIDEIQSTDDIEIMLTVNGEVRQHDYLRNMTLRFPDLISYWSPLGLRPGDLVLSGTPAGVGIFLEPRGAHLLRPGDVVICSSPQLGRLKTTIVQADPEPGGKREPQGGS